MSDHIHPTIIEKEFLDISYNRFHDLYDEIMNETFWDKEPSYRLYRVKEIFAVYFELLKYTHQYNGLLKTKIDPFTLMLEKT
jgi:transposase InsO family protein